MIQYICFIVAMICLEMAKLCLNMGIFGRDFFIFVGDLIASRYRDRNIELHY